MPFWHFSCLVYNALTYSGGKIFDKNFVKLVAARVYRFDVLIKISFDPVKG